MKNVEKIEFYIFVDVFEKVIFVVIYIKVINMGEIYIGFVIGKFKLVFYYGYIILRLELCVVFFVIEIVLFVEC